MPPGPGAFSALGMLLADVQHDFARTRVMGIDEADPELLEAEFEMLHAEGAVKLADEGFDSDAMSFERFMDMRYQGQEHAVMLPIGTVQVTDDRMEEIKTSFGQAHERLYGHVLSYPIQLVTLRVRATGSMDQPEFPTARPASGDPADSGKRPVHTSGGVTAYRVFDRASLGAGATIEGPAVILETTSTTILHPGDVLEVGSYGELSMSIRERSDHD